MLPIGYISPLTKEERQRVTVLVEMDIDSMTLAERAFYLIMMIEDSLKEGTLYWDKETGRLLTWPQQIILSYAKGKEVVVKEMLN
jgi:hypothetical protein